MSSKPENFNVYLTPHLEKYQTPEDEETSRIMQSTWNFGNKLKAKGYNLVYMCGPVGLYEGNLLVTETLEFGSKDHVNEFIEKWPKNDFLYFMYAKEAKVLRYTAIPTSLIIEQRKSRKKSLTKRHKPNNIIEKGANTTNDNKTK